MERKCTDCKNCLLQDYGYSNWTVEGTSVYCMNGKHPDGEFDKWYGSDKRLLYANECGSFEKGEPQDIDVELENWDDLSDKAKAFLRGCGWNR